MSRPPKGPSQRQLRVGEMVRHALADVLVRERLDGVDATRVTVSEVSMSPDLKIATAFVAPAVEAGNREAPDVEEVCRALARNARLIRMRAAPKLDHMRALPNLRFRPDTSFSNFERIDALLRSPAVARDLDRSEGDA